MLGRDGDRVNVFVMLRVESLVRSGNLVKESMAPVEEEVIEQDAEHELEQLHVDRLIPCHDVVDRSDCSPFRDEEKTCEADWRCDEDGANNHSESLLNQSWRDFHSRFQRDAILLEKFVNVENGEKSIYDDVRCEMDSGSSDDEDEHIREVVTSRLQVRRSHFFGCPFHDDVVAVVKETVEARKVLGVADKVKEEGGNQSVCDQVVKHEGPKSLQDDANEIGNDRPDGWFRTTGKIFATYR